MDWRKFSIEEEESHDYWMSYSDLMAGLILILLLFLSISTFTFQESAQALEETEKIVSEQKAELEKQQEMIEEIIGIRSRIIIMLIQQFAETDMKIDVDEKTGSIRLESGVFFDSDAYVLKEKGKEFLDHFIPQYLNVLLDDEFDEYIGEIIIEGHTDTQGRYQYNLDLSQKRAFEVASYVLNDEFDAISPLNKTRLKEILTANGRSFSTPIYEGDEIDLAASRRVEFKFRLKDSDMIDEMNRILNEGE